MINQRIIAASSLDINALLEFSRVLNESEDADFIYGNVLLSLMGKLGLGRTAVALHEDEGVYRIDRVKGGAADLLGARFEWNGGSGSGLFPLDVIADEDARERLRRARVEHLMHIASADRTYALVLLSSPLVGRTLGPDEINYALLIGVIAAMALDGCRMRGSLHDVNRRLERRVHRLRSLFEAGREFNALLDRGAILRLLGYSLMGEMAIGRYAVALRGPDGYRLVVNRLQGEPAPETIGVLAAAGTLRLAPREEADDELAALHDLGVRVSIPMEVQGESHGVLLVGKRLQFEIDDEDLEYLGSLANLAMTSLENARLLEEMVEKKRMEEDLRIAWEIQQGLLPAKLPKIEGFEVHARTIPSRQVGGDCYDAIDLGDGRVLLSIADVSGKGTPASLLMANVQAAVRTLARLGLPLDNLVARINDVIYENTACDKFITAFFGIIDSATGRFTYVNAGHNPPFLFGKSAVRPLESGGLILGVMPTTIPYEVGTEELMPGDLLLLYTDGVSEALDPDRQEYGEDRLRDLLTGKRTMTATEAVDRTYADILKFTRGAQQSDDITIVALRRFDTVETIESAGDDRVSGRVVDEHTLPHSV